MTRFLVRRLLNYLVLLALASFLTFSLTSLSFRRWTACCSATRGPRNRSSMPRPPSSTSTKPIPLRYAHWASGGAG